MPTVCVYAFTARVTVDGVDRHQVGDPAGQHRRVVDGLVDLRDDDGTLALSPPMTRNQSSARRGASRWSGPQLGVERLAWC